MLFLWNSVYLLYTISDIETYLKMLHKGNNEKPLIALESIEIKRAMLKNTPLRNTRSDLRKVYLV